MAKCSSALSTVDASSKYRLMKNRGKGYKGSWGGVGLQVSAGTGKKKKKKKKQDAKQQLTFEPHTHTHTHSKQHHALELLPALKEELVEWAGFLAL